MKSSFKGIVLAGGTGSRLHPITKGVSKQLLPIFDKPMVYYPISVLMLAGIRDICVVCAPKDLGAYESVLGDGAAFGICISYVTQPEPDGIPQAFLLAKDFIGDSSVALVLGDNFFYGQHFTNKLNQAVSSTAGATIFGYRVSDPERFGVVAFDEDLRVISIDEKPKSPKSNYAITGLYFYDNLVVEYSGQLLPSSRGELEISDLNKIYLEQGRLNLQLLGRGFAWLDTGTHESLLEAGNFVQTIEKRQGQKIACLEEIAFNNGWLTKDQVYAVGRQLHSTSYGRYLLGLF